ncbi:MAG: TonB-dependent receptor, partial [Tannerella sp.]|nr:TonB-dependent receptor [Tannerella sp.]
GSFRRDYAGRLPEGKKYGDFPSFTAAWKVSEEGFFPKTDAINLIKLRGSWGRIGNLSSIGAAYGDPTLGMETTISFTGEPRQRVPLIAHMRWAFNPLLTWETSEQTDFGIDLDFLKNRLSVSAEYFHKRTFNLIKTRDLGYPTYVGLEPMQVNEGEIRNTGLEFTFGWKDRISKDLSYFVNANFATLNNKVTDIGLNKETVWHTGASGGRVGAPFRTIEGGQFYSYWLVKTDGLFQTDAEAEAYVDKDGKRIQPYAKAGDLKFIDQLTVDTNGDGIPDASDGKIDNADRIQMDAYFPKLTYALTAGLTFKNLTASIMLQGIGKANAFRGYKFIAYSESYGAFARDSRILNAWPVTSDIPRLNAQDQNGNFTTLSDWYLEDASYMRIKNISLSYSLDDLIRRSAHFGDKKSSLSVSLSIDNLYTFTGYSGMDPEVSTNGVDIGKYPVPRIISLGLKLTY